MEFIRGWNLGISSLFAFFSFDNYNNEVKNLVILADYSNDSLTTQELRSAFIGHLSQPFSSQLSFVYSTPSTIHTAFLLKQILLTESRLGDPNNLVIFVNTDPRLQTTTGVRLSKGAQFIVAKLKNGAWVCGPNAGSSFSLIREEIAYLYLYPNLDKGNQFRSREFYMRVSALLVEEKQDEMDLEEIRNNDIPVLSQFYVGHIDNYGNIKTTIPHSYMKGKHEYNEKVKVTLNNHNKEVIYADNMFGAGLDKLVLAPGSSGMPDDPYLELVVWQHYPDSSARGLFPQAKPGDKVEVE
jgi:hypothetical protein